MTVRTPTTIVRWVPNLQQLYRWLDAGATYDPASSYASVARFGDGTIKTLYLAATPEGAMAEYFRRHPEFLALQDKLAIRLFEVDLRVEGTCVDVRTDAGQRAADITRDRLVSSEHDENLRYAECRELATWAVAESFDGISYPSAAAMWDTWNLVLFGDPTSGRWIATGTRVIARPIIEETAVRCLA